MRAYILKRVAQILLTYFLFLTGVFFLIDAQPGDFGAAYFSDPRLTAEQRHTLSNALGLNKPVGERYVQWIGNFLKGDLGVSFSNYPRPVTDVIVERAPRTIVLFLTATVVSFYTGFAAGKFLAWKRGQLLEYTATIAGVSLFTVFTPWFALVMIWLFAFRLGWVPIGKFINAQFWMGSPVTAGSVFQQMLVTAILAGLALFTVLFLVRRLDARYRNYVRWGGFAVILAGVILYWAQTGIGTLALDILHHLILPVSVVTLISFGGTMLLTRNSMLETLREDYILAARAKGLTEKEIRDKHAARNAMLPVVTAFVFNLAFTLDGGIITETIFSWPGMGATLLEAAITEDIPMVMGGLVFTGFLALTAHLVADIMYAYLDPRIRYA
ncbi:MAG: ABC transporter permease [Anaerolineales bacterium]